MQPTQAVIFFDGVCGLCNRFVDLVLTLDTGKVFLMAPLQGETSARLLGADLGKDLNTVVLRHSDGTIYTKSAAVIRIVSELSWPLKFLKVFSLLPSWLLDPFYDLVSRNRYKAFGKRDSCRIPSPSERERFLP